MPAARATPKRSPGATPKRSPEATPKRSPDAAPKHSPVLAPKRSPELAPKRSPEFAKRDERREDARRDVHFPDRPRGARPRQVWGVGRQDLRVASPGGRPSPTRFPQTPPSLGGLGFYVDLDQLPPEKAAEIKLGFEYRTFVRKQVEYYLSPGNLRQDPYFHGLASQREGWCSVSDVCRGERLRRLRVNEDDVRLALRGSKLEVRERSELPDLPGASPATGLWFVRGGLVPLSPRVVQAAEHEGHEPFPCSMDDEVLLEYPLLCDREEIPERIQALMPKLECPAGVARILLGAKGPEDRLEDRDLGFLCRLLGPWLQDEGARVAEVDLSGHGLGDVAAARFLAWLQQQDVELSVLKLYKNRLGDAAVEQLAALVRAQETCLEEVHLSHNRITGYAVPRLLEAFASHAAYPRRLAEDQAKRARGGPDSLAAWVRLEQNLIDPSLLGIEPLVQEGRVRKVTHTDRKALRVRRDKHACRVVVYGLHWQEERKPRTLSADAPCFVPSGVSAELFADPSVLAVS